MIGGMLTATFIAIFLIPMFFVVMMKLFRVTPAIHRHASEKGPDKAPELAMSGD